MTPASVHPDVGNFWRVVHGPDVHIVWDYREALKLARELNEKVDLARELNEKVDEPCQG